MAEIVRKLAVIERVLELNPHPNADKIEIAKIRGWNIIVQKELYEVDDLVVFFEIDWFLPVKDVYEFLRKSSFKSTKNLGDGFRIKTMKLRGVVSQGLILPTSDAFGANEWAELGLKEGDDVTEYLGVQKYEKPISSNLAGKVRGNFPSFVPKTDQERLQNVGGRDKHDHGQDEFEMTEKMDGSSMTVYHKDDVFGVCSRNLDLLPDEENTFWQVANNLNLREILPNNIALQGELLGPGVQGNPYNLKGHEFHIFDVWMIDAQSYMIAEKRSELVRVLGLQPVKGLGFVTGIPTPVEAQALCHSVKEGIVFKSLTDPSFSFKYINENYLLKEKD